MSSNGLYKFTEDDPAKLVFTFGQKMKALRGLRELEFAALDRGASPEGAVLMVYRRALDFYDQQWPGDEGKFRNTLLRMQEKRMQKIMRQKRARDKGLKDAFEASRDISDQIPDYDQWAGGV